MLMFILLFIFSVLSLVCILSLTLSDTETFKAIDKKIANKINREKIKKEN